MGKEISNLFQEHAEDALLAIRDVMDNGVKDSDRLAAANSILDRGYGKPSQAIIQIPPSKRQAALLAAMSDEDLVAVIEQKKLPSLFPKQPAVEVEFDTRVPSFGPHGSNPHGVTDCYIDETDEPSNPEVDELLL